MSYTSSACSGRRSIRSTCGEPNARGHLIRRCVDLIAIPGAINIWYPRAIMRALQQVIALRNRRDEFAASTYARHCRDLERRINRSLSGTSRVPDYERLRRHMAKHREQLLVCLYERHVEPTNNLAKGELRGAVVIRRLGGCNRSDQHAEAHAVIASVAQTAHGQGTTMTDFVTRCSAPMRGQQRRTERRATPAIHVPLITSMPPNSFLAFLDNRRTEGSTGVHMMIEHRCMWWRLALLVVALAWGPGCTKENPKSCRDGFCNDPAFPVCDVDGTLGGAPGECIAPECTAGEIVACNGSVAVRCNSAMNGYDNIQCSGGCDLASGGCIGCGTDDECGGFEPVCELDTHECRGCRSDDECASTVCDLDTGACVAAADIVYATADGTGPSPCTQAQPCPLQRAITTSLGMAVPAVVRMLPGRYAAPIEIGQAKASVIVATGALLSTDSAPPLRLSDGATLSVRGLELDVKSPQVSAVECGYEDTQRSTLNMRDMVIASSTSTGATVGIYMCTVSAKNVTLRADASGALIAVQTDGQLRLDRSKLINANSSASVRLGGFGLRRKLVITNSLFDRVQLQLSGDTYTEATTTTYEVAFNTFVDHLIECNNPSNQRLTAIFENNIYRFFELTPADSIFLGPECSFQNNIFFPAAMLGGSNRDVDPQLRDLAARDFRLKPTSPAIDSAVPSMALPATPDLLGVQRPQGGQADVGAYEHVP